MTNYFPVVHSTLQTDALANFISSRYGLDEITHTQYWNQSINDTYRIQTKTGDYIFRLYPFGRCRKEEILFEIDAIAFLSQQAIPIAKSMTDEAGIIVQEIPCPEGTRFAVLFAVAPGTAPRKFLTQKQSYIIGRTLAKLHQGASGFHSQHKRPDIGYSTLLSTALATLSIYLRLQPQELATLQSIATDIQNTVADLPMSAPFWTLCVGDLHAGNVHFIQDHQLTLFEFDQCGYGHRCFDLAKFLHTCQNLAIPAKVQQAFMNGYQEITPLTPEEIAAFAPLQMAAQIWALHNHAIVAAVSPASRLPRSLFDKKLKHLKEMKKTL